MERNGIGDMGKIGDGGQQTGMDKQNSALRPAPSMIHESNHTATHRIVTGAPAPPFPPAAAAAAAAGRHARATDGVSERGGGRSHDRGDDAISIAHTRLLDVQLARRDLVERGIVQDDDGVGVEREALE